ncbi:3-oxoacyl-ACP synthase III family protein [Microbacter margulisiae]|uniref:3-oxoacyl-[acyl-carrier-protein] synthase-3 n=1 Tax=Microbacter margulisiae TaxID=1350067 RepID=A0A7W5DNE8_9PORP|nr:ketoacyl-ACP synthase III [Microbacter margulisiae]MBB3185971.1 3-oxoacyl-[acyl-carrier-protein] synthase-3 [Microbacter margulisiae]
MQAYIKHISYYLPENKLTNEQLIQEFPEWTVEKVASKIGISTRHIATKDETSADMAYKAATNLFTEHNIQPSEIDFILFCTQSPDYFLPTSACILQQRLGIPQHAGALDFNLGCSGYIYGLSLAKGLISASIAHNVLLLTAETYSKFLHPMDKANRTIFGDGASATLIGSEGIAAIQNFSLGTDGGGYDRLIVKSRGMRHPDSIGNLVFDEKNNPKSSDYLYMDGTEIFNFTLDVVPNLIQNTLVANHLKQEQIDQFIFHQANKYMLSYLRKKLQIPEDKFYYFLESVGNTVSSTIPIALKEAMHDSTIQSNHNVLLAGFGVGYSWGGTILKFL